MRRKVISRMFFDRVKRFSKDEAGGMLVLMLVVFFGITIFGGLAVDLAVSRRFFTTTITRCRDCREFYNWWRHANQNW